MFSTRYSQTFARLKKENKLGFCPFAVLESPNDTECLQRIKMYLAAGADMLELGIPFSDPVADGPVVAHATEIALKNGATTKKCISLIKKIRKLTDSPLGILCYANSIHSYGITSFYHDAAKAGADSVLIADCPPEELAPFYEAAQNAGIHTVCIVTQDTDAKRLKEIEKFSSAFLYVVSTLGVTGTRSKLNPQLAKTLQFLTRNTSTPLAVGFGLSTKEHFASIKKAGALCGIVGSYLVKEALNALPEKLAKLTKI